jgi:hypothetical protein
MQDDLERCDDRRRTTLPLRALVCSSATLIAVVVALAGCGGSDSPSSSVAHLGTHTSASRPAAASSGDSEASPGSQAVAYAACMRAHGVANFPDPRVSRQGNEVRVRMAVPAGVGGNPQFGAAQRACRKLLPGGGPGNQPVLSAADQAQYLKAAACIRAHGVPSFPDPTFSGGGVHIQHQGLNESSPAFTAAVRACESLIPGGAHGAGSGSTREAAP